MMRLILLAFLIPFAFACVNLTSAQLANTTTDIPQGTCINVTDWNAVLNSPSVATNDIINQTAFQSYTDPTLNRTFNCNYDKLNTNQSLSFSGIYSEPNHNITISCPAYPLSNLNINISAGTSYTNSTLNLTINALHDNISRNISLNFSENYTNSLIGLNITAPPYPKLNINKSLGYNESYIDDLSNITIIAPQFPSINETSVLSCGQNKDYPTIGIHITGPACLNVDKDLGFGESFDNPAYGIHVRAPSRFDRAVNLSENQSFNDSKSNLTVSCNPSQQDFIDFCKTVNDTPMTGVWERYNISENYTYPVQRYTCLNLDNLTPQCTIEEKLNGVNGFAGCWNRNLDAMQTFCKDKQDEANKWHSEYMTLNSSFAQGGAQVQGNNDFAKTWVGGSLLLISSGFLAFLYIRKKNDERRH